MAANRWETVPRSQLTPEQKQRVDDENRKADWALRLADINQRNSLQPIGGGGNPAPTVGRPTYGK